MSVKMTQSGNVLSASGAGEKEMSEMITDSRKKSLSEAFVNSFGAYPIGYAIGVIILPISVGWIHTDPLMANVFITLTYASVSFVRVYFLRRLFDRLGYDDNFIKLAIKLYRKLAVNIAKNTQLIRSSKFNTLSWMRGEGHV